ncbi:hypothetical protein JL720_11991 [Aureococcus anophagefferens]|nr:hypothetical protein JL720_11991 [Aureococcus anophagefferens]
MPPKVLPPVELALPKDFDHEQPYERDRKRMAMVTQRDGVAAHLRRRPPAPERLIGFNSKNEKEPTLVERYPKWAELHTPQEKLDYEARMRKYKPMEFFTPYGRNEAEVRHGAAKKRQSLRQLAAQKSKQFSAASKLYIEDAKYKAGVLRATLSTPKRDGGRAAAARSASGPEGAPGADGAASPDAKRPHGAGQARGPRRQGPGALGPGGDGAGRQAKRAQFKKSFFKLPGSNKTPVKDEDKPKTGARTTVAKRLFMKKTIQPRQPREPRE